jgi:tetratricopeptide (TPR) repeat protein
LREARDALLGGQAGHARSLLLRVLEVQPDCAEAMLQLSYVESVAGSYRSARDWVFRALRGAALAPRAIADLASRLRTFNEGGALEALAARLAPESSLDIRLLLVLASQFSYLNDQERALRYLDEAFRADPNYPPTLLARAQVLVYAGRMQDAEDDLSRCLRRAPEIPKLYWLLSRLRRQHADDNHVGAIRERLRRGGLDAEGTALLEFALHKELDDLGEHRDAWFALERGCKAKRSSLRYSTEESAALFQDLEAWRPAAQRAKEIPPAGKRRPVFIVGMHRSGTSLLEHLLAGHSAVGALGELYDFTSRMREATDHHCRGVLDRTLVARARHVDFSGVGSRYLAGLEWRLRDERAHSDKLPSNFLNIGFICEALPEARILHMVRDPMDTCFSNLRELFSDANPYSYEQRELGAYHGAYRRLMRHWDERYPGRILDVSYARLIADPRAETQRVAKFLDLPFEDAMADNRGRDRAVATASAVQVRAKLVAPEAPKWLPYARWLGPLADDLAAPE